MSRDAGAGVLGAEADRDDRDLLVAEPAGGDQGLTPLFEAKSERIDQPGDPLVVLGLRASRPRASRCRGRSRGPRARGGLLVGLGLAAGVVSNR